MKFVLVSAVILAGSLGSVAAADLAGKVTLKGTPPPEKNIVMDSDPKCGALHQGKPAATTRHYLVDGAGGLANVFVYIAKGLEGKTFPTPTDKPLVDQVNCFYEPFVMGVQVGQLFRIKNSDGFLHNVHSMPKLSSGNKEFNFAQLAKDQINEKSFPNAEVMVRFKCDVHNWMFAYIGVLPHPYFAVTGKDGTFNIQKVPPGKYTLEAYHVKTHGTNPGLSQEITLEGDKKVDFTIELK